MNKNTSTELHRLVGVAATVLDPEQVNVDDVQRWAEGRGLSAVSDLSDRAFRQFVKAVATEQAARRQEAADLARLGL